MTIAVDKVSGKVIGQVTRTGYDCTPGGRAIGPLQYRLLTGSGYRYVDAASVRLERTGD